MLVNLRIEIDIYIQFYPLKLKLHKHGCLWNTYSPYLNDEAITFFWNCTKCCIRNSFKVSWMNGLQRFVWNCSIERAFLTPANQFSWFLRVALFYRKYISTFYRKKRILYENTVSKNFLVCQISGLPRTLMRGFKSCPIFFHPLEDIHLLLIIYLLNNYVKK